MKQQISRRLKLLVRVSIIIAMVMTTISSTRNNMDNIVTTTPSPKTGAIAAAAETPLTPAVIRLDIVQLDNLKPESKSILEIDESESEPIEPEPEPEKIANTDYDLSLSDREMIARTIYREANVDHVGELEGSKVVWTILNRLDSGIAWFGRDIPSILKQYDYRPSSPITEQNLALVNDVVKRWSDEKSGKTDVGRTLPADYYSFWGDGKANHFWKWSSGGIGLPGDYKIYY